MTDEKQYISEEKKREFEAELKTIEQETIPGLAKRIDDARQMGDLSENAEYQQAREDMTWARSRAAEIRSILSDAEVLHAHKATSTVEIGSTVVVFVGGKERTYELVGAQEADPSAGKISNESPIGRALFGKKKSDKVTVSTPAGNQEYTIQEVR